MGQLFEGIESEIARRMVHVSGSTLPLAHVLAPDLLTWQRLQLILVGGAVLAAILETIRLGIGLDWKLYDYLTREYEQDNPAGYALAVFSATGVALVTPPTVAVPAILMLTLGDPISGLLGSSEPRAFGDADRFQVLVKRPPILALMFAVCSAIGAAFVAPVAAVFGGLAAMAADGVKPIVVTFVIDDNLTIPPAAAAAMTLGLAIV